jgi:DNA polymerase I-like protein with 3'-5' exonuclease and polymerase domains
VQSTASDIFLRQAIKICDLLKEKKSFISFMIHDSLVIDFCEGERDMILPIVQNFSRTNFGDFLANVKVGKNFGEMKELKWNTTS